MSDLISRQEAKKKHCEICRDTNLCYRNFSTCPEVKAFDSISPAERPKGKWVIGIKRPSIGTQCDACGWAWSANIDAVKLEPCLALIKTRYCPNCGAKMEEAKT